MKKNPSGYVPLIKMSAHGTGYVAITGPCDGWGNGDGINDGNGSGWVCPHD